MRGDAGHIPGDSPRVGELNLHDLHIVLGRDKGGDTPGLGGDCKLDQETFLLEPVSSENLHASRSTRNFWCVTEEGCWSAAGASAQQEADRFTEKQDECALRT